MRDITNNLKLVKSILPINATATQTGTGVDLKGYEGADVEVAVGAPGDTLSGSVKQTWTVEDSADNSTFATVASAYLIDPQGLWDLTGTNGQLVINANAKASAVYQLGYIGTKEYVRVVCTLAGSHSTGTPISASVNKGVPRVSPATA